MPIDVEKPRSPGWWMQRLFNQLANRDRRNRLQNLQNYRTGHAPLPQGAENAREAFCTFQAKARSNFAELIVSATSERMTPVGFRTAQDSDATGDAEVGELWERTGLDVESCNVHDMMLTLSEAYVIVGAVDEETGAPLVTSEDPRWMVGEHDPGNPRRLLAALKVLHDDAEGEDRAYLFLPGEVHVATRKSSYTDLTMDFTRTRAGESRQGPIINFDPRSWDWSEDRSGKLPHKRMPVVRFVNKDAMGEFEHHRDLLDRINDQILQRMVIATMQAFRQRAVLGLPLVYGEDHENAGQEIDYSEVFTSDPAALWQLPETAKMWESGTVDLRPILEAVKDDLQHLAAVTRTPMHMLSPSGQNQSAEGASLEREGLVFKARDRIIRTSHAWAQVMSLVLLHAGMTDRADLAKLRTIWLPPDHLSLAERADAASKLSGLLPKRTLLITVLGYSPAEADRIMTEVADDELLAAQLAAAALAAQPQPPVAGQPVQPAGGRGEVPQPEMNMSNPERTPGPGRSLPPALAGRR